MKVYPLTSILLCIPTFLTSCQKLPETIMLVSSGGRVDGEYFSLCESCKSCPNIGTIGEQSLLDVLTIKQSLATLLLRAPGPLRGAGARSSLATFSSRSCCSLSVIWVGQAWLFAAGLMRAVSRDLFNKQRHAVTRAVFRQP